MLPYPFSYFSSIWGFRKPLSQRFGLNWFQLIFTSIFLISLSMVPIAIQNSSQETYPLETFIDDVYAPLTDEVVQDLAKNAQIVDGKLSYTGSTPHQTSVQSGLLLVQVSLRNYSLALNPSNSSSVSKEKS